MIKLLKYLKGYNLPAVMGLILKFIEAVFDLIVPFVVAGIIDKGIGGNDGDYIWKMGALLLLLGLLGFGFSTSCQYFAAHSALGFGTNLRGKIYSHVNSLSCADLDKLGIPSLITRITSDVNNAQQSVNMFIRLATRAPFMLIGSIVAAMMISVKLSLIFIGATLLVSLALFTVMKSTLPLYKKANRQLDNVSLLTRENITGVRVVRAFSKQHEETEDFAFEANALASTTKKASIISALMTPLSFAIVNMATVLILYFGSFDVSAGGLSRGEVIALTNYMVHIFYSLTILATLAVVFTKGVASSKRINKVLETVSSISYGNLTSTNAQAAASVTDTAIEVKDIIFSYGTNINPSLEGINFTLKKGEILGIIGRTGSGKSSIINLIQRFYDAEAGSVTLFGNDIRAYDASGLRSLVAAVPQTATLFSGTIRENMQLGNQNATDEQIWAALKIAQADSFVNKLPEKLDAKVIKGGKNFSGGQRQRLTIARALIKNAPILVLDDSASALDFATDAKLRRSIKKTQGDKAIIIISQRAPSIMHADKILVLEHGRQVGLDTHAKLMENCDIYKEIFISQVAEEN